MSTCRRTSWSGNECVRALERNWVWGLDKTLPQPTTHTTTDFLHHFSYHSYHHSHSCPYHSFTTYLYAPIHTYLHIHAHAHAHAHAHMEGECERLLVDQDDLFGK